MSDTIRPCFCTMTWMISLLVFSLTSVAFKTYLGNCVLKYLLEVKVTRKPDGIFLCQCKYTLDTLHQTGPLGLTVVILNHKLGRASKAILSDLEQYHQLVDHLIYLSFTQCTLHILNIGKLHLWGSLS